MSARSVFALSVLVIVSLQVALPAPASAQGAKLEAFKQNDAAYQILQTELRKHKALSAVGLERNDWCTLAQKYDASGVSLQRALDQRRFLCGTEWCSISQTDIPGFKSLQESTALEMRNAERRCR